MSIAGERSGIGCQVRVSARGKQAEAGTRRAADAARQKNEANLKVLFVIALWAFSLYPNSGLRDRAGPRTNHFEEHDQW
jgi:hypothetical protein